MTRGGTRYDGSPSRFDHGLHRTTSDGFALTIAAHGIRLIAIVHPAGTSSDDADKAWKNPMIAVRSSCDRGAIEPRSHVFRRGIDPTQADDDRRSSTIMIDAQSWLDRGAIVARSWCDRGKNLRLFDR